MLRKLALATLTCATLIGGAACAPVGQYQGFQAIEANPADVRVGQDTRTTVSQRLGTPTATDTFDHNAIWFYISQSQATTAFLRPRVTRRDVVAISFDQATEQVTSVNHYTLADGRVIAYNDRETPTRGREMTVLEQLLGNIGRGGMLPREQDAPGQRPDDRR
jgi:outer membrane protein assembly factor BamE (lipoprotein component of BamABCDE complex)